MTLPYLVRWEFEDEPDAKLPYVLIMDINSTHDETLPSALTRLGWLRFALEHGSIHDDYEPQDGYWIWRFKTEGARMFFAMATAGWGEN